MLRHLITTVALFIAAGLAQAGEAGRIVFVTGQSQIAGRGVALGDAVQEGDEISTGADGYIYLKTIDNGFLILRPGSRARVVTYHVDAQNPANTRVKFELINGVARAISGQAVKQARHNFRFNTPVAAIGVRGTDFTVFTDHNTSRVTVISGGVVVSGFSGACGPDGAGPCEGSTSRELFAEQTGQLLQIQKGQAAPQLLRSTGLSPDLAAPPRKDEPVSSAHVVRSPLAGNELSLDPQKSDSIIEGGILARPTPTPAPPPDTTTGPPNLPAVPSVPPLVVLPPVEPTPPAIPRPPEFIWGRWKEVANLPIDSDILAKIRSGDYVAGEIVGAYVMARVKNTELVMPSHGQVSFSLVESEAYIRDRGRAPVAATIQDSRFDVDFATKGFSTSLQVVAPGARVDIRANGGITANGELISGIIGSNATVRGFIGGADAREAGYIFESSNNPALSAFGATRWAR